MSLLHPSPKKGRFDLGETLYQKYLDGKNVDTVLVVGPCRQFHVHRAVLTSASDVFDEVLKGRKGGVQDPNIIRLPDGTTDVAAKAFIQVRICLIVIIKFKLNLKFIGWHHYRSCI